MRLIDADKLEMSLNEKLDAAITRNANSLGEIAYFSSLATLIAVTDCISSVNAQPNIDAVSVVRCKDCRWFAGEGMYCTNNILTQFDHFFCYYGERKEDKK